LSEKSELERMARKLAEKNESMATNVEWKRE
jgi:hypothetical protein